VSSGLVRIGPVHFQSLEHELEPVARYLDGHLLDAGCGSRDIRDYLEGNGVTRLTRYDLEATDPDVVVGPLERMPFETDSFDAALCNAVLEHVADVERSIRELARVVRPGGHVVVAVPFLQPFHANPGDYRRYTADGLAELGRAAGLEVVDVLPVHTFAQTLGWLLWEHAAEKGGRWRKALAYAVAYPATRLWHRTDPTLRRNANTFQAVYRVPPEGAPDVLGNWRDEPAVVATAGVPTMLVPDELRLLHHLTDRWWTGAGAIVDAGCFLGGSTIALAEGLRRNLARHGLPERPLIHTYDRFQVEDWTRGVYFPEETPAGASFRDRFDRNVSPYASLVEVHAGDVQDHPWEGGPIEVLFIDLAKHWRTCDWVTWQFFPHLIPGRSIVVQQDYLYHHWVAWLHITMERYAAHFEYVCDTGVNSVAFRCTSAIPPEELSRHTVGDMSTEEKIELMDRAAARFEGTQRELLVSAKQHFLEMLERGDDEDEDEQAQT
jgi:SAM-dependent methyltransferase